jgi:hypothetical protein
MKKVIFLPFFLILVFSSCKKQGCTDSSANNYNSSANEDNGNCTYSLLDIEGNSYGAKSIGNQIWMTENLKEQVNLFSNKIFLMKSIYSCFNLENDEDFVVPNVFYLLI